MPLSVVLLGVLALRNSTLPSKWAPRLVSWLGLVSCFTHSYDVSPTLATAVLVSALETPQLLYSPSFNILLVLTSVLSGYAARYFPVLSMYLKDMERDTEQSSAEWFHSFDRMVRFDMQVATPVSIE